MSLTSTARRLAAMSGDEVRFRVRARSRTLVERARHALVRPRWSRASIASVLEPTLSTAVADACSAARRGDFLEAHRALGRHFRTRRSVWPLRDADREMLVRAIGERFPDAVDDAVRAADALAEGRHNLLGHRNVSCGMPPDWHRDAVSGARAPSMFWAAVPYLDPGCGDHKVIWELNRHQHWRTLGRAYWLTGRQRYRDVFIAELESWLAANPPGTGINWASMLELGLRSLSWTWTIELFAREADRDATPWLVDLLVAIDRQLAHVSRNLSIYFSPNTHLTGEALGLYAASRALPELRRSRARAEQGREVLLVEAARQIRSDGGHIELSPHYHRYSTDFYLLALLVARGAGDAAAADFEAALRAQAQYLRTIADDRGQLPLIGDDDGGQLFGFCGGRPFDASPTLAAAASVLDDASLAPAPATEEVFWILGRPPAIPSIDAVAEGWPSRVLPASGYVVSRTREGDHLVFDAGPHGFLNGGHAHSDALSIVLSVAGRPLLVDPGTATYTMDASIRNSFRSTRMHNTVVIDGRDHAMPHGPFHWHDRPDARLLASRLGSQVDFAQGAHRAYEPIIHVRSVVAIHGVGWVVVDQILAERDQRDRHVTAESYWHLHPDWMANRSRVEGRGSRIEVRGPVTDNCAALALAFTSSDAAVVHDAEFARYAPEYGRLEPAFTVRVTEAGVPPFAMGAFVPARPEVARTASIAPLAIAVPPPAGWVGAAFAVTAGNRQLSVLVAATPDFDEAGEPGVRWGTSTAQTDGRFAVAEQARTDSPLLASALHIGHAELVEP